MPNLRSRRRTEFNVLRHTQRREVGNVHKFDPFPLINQEDKEHYNDLRKLQFLILQVHPHSLFSMKIEQETFSMPFLDIWTKMCSMDAKNNFEITRQILSDLDVETRLNMCLRNYDQNGVPAIRVKYMTIVLRVFVILPVIYDIFGQNLSVINRCLKQEYPRLHKRYNFVSACQEIDLVIKGFGDIQNLIFICLKYNCSHSSELKTISTNIQDQFKFVMKIPTGTSVDEWAATEIS